MKEEFDFESIKNKAIEQLKAGKPLLGKDGAFAPLLESILNAALEGRVFSKVFSKTHFSMAKYRLPLTENRASIV